MLLGIPALIAYLGAIFTLLGYQWKHLREAEETTLIAAGAVAGYLISAFFGITIFYTTPFLFFFWGMAARVRSAVLPDASAFPRDAAAACETPDASTALNTPDTSDVSDSADVSDMADVSDSPDILDMADVSDSPDISNMADALKTLDAPDTSGISETGADSKLPRFSLRTILACIVIFLFLSVWCSLTVILYQEARRETADLLAMERAAAAGKKYADGEDLSAQFWYDQISDTVYSTDALPPDAYGQGTAVNGKILMTSELSQIGYNAETDYRRCVLMTQASQDDGETTDAPRSDSRTESSGKTASKTYHISAAWVYLYQE